MFSLSLLLSTQEINVHDSPTIITILDSSSASNNGMMMCVGYKHHFEVVCEQSGQFTRLHDIETSKRSQAQLVAAMDLCDGQETELLLCYNRKLSLPKHTLLPLEPINNRCVHSPFQIHAIFRNCTTKIDRTNSISTGIRRQHRLCVHSPISLHSHPIR